MRISAVLVATKINGKGDKFKSEAAHHTSRHESQLFILTFGLPLVFEWSSFL